VAPLASAGEGTTHPPCAERVARARLAHGTNSCADTSIRPACRSHHERLKIGVVELADLSEGLHGVRPSPTEGALMATPIRMTFEDPATTQDVDARAHADTRGGMWLVMLAATRTRRPVAGTRVALELAEAPIERVPAIDTGTRRDEHGDGGDGEATAWMPARADL
jgi:hypothetical protein